MPCSSSGEELAGEKRGFDALAAQTRWRIIGTKSVAIKWENDERKKERRIVIDGYDERLNGFCQVSIYV